MSIGYDDWKNHFKRRPAAQAAPAQPTEKRQHPTFLDAWQQRQVLANDGTTLTEFTHTGGLQVIESRADNARALIVTTRFPRPPTNGEMRYVRKSFGAMSATERDAAAPRARLLVEAFAAATADGSGGGHPG